MRRVLIFLTFLFALISIKVDAQIYSPQLAGHFGPRIIYYQFGYYQGNVSNGIANGLGTFYYTDGTFFYGHFYNGVMHGHGMVVSPYYGYLEGHWMNGQFVGACPNQNHNRNRNQVRDIIQDVQISRPDNSLSSTAYSNVSPEGYEIKRIDPTTQMGKVMLGKINN